jgi:hypothetical protein
MRRMLAAGNSSYSSRVADGDGDRVDGVHQPPEQPAYAQKEDEQDAPAEARRECEGIRESGRRARPRPEASRRKVSPRGRA